MTISVPGAIAILGIVFFVGWVLGSEYMNQLWLEAYQKGEIE